jgi:alkylhydroperoxidase family enzyme
MRIQVRNQSEYPWYIRLIFWAQKRKYGKVLGPAYLWGRVPALMLGLQIYYRFLDRKSCLIAKELKALVSLRVSQLNHCAFCFDLSSSFLANLAIPQEKLEFLLDFRSSARFSEKEKSALAYAEAMTRSGDPVSSEVFSLLHEYFSDDEIIELTSWISFQNLSSKFNSALDVAPQGFCVRPPAASPVVSTL